MHCLYPNNLIPIRKHCNGKKLARIHQNGNRLFKHLFSELNGAIGFLRASVGYQPNLNVKFEVVQIASLSQAQFLVLQNHFEKLGLADRYARQASTTLAKLVRQFRSPPNLALGPLRLRQRLDQIAADRVAILPPDHWEAVLMQALALNDDFADHIFK